MMMLSCSNSIIMCSNIISHKHQAKNIRKFTTFAKLNPSDNNSSDSDYPIVKKILGQACIAVLGLGFVDAGYSGDWSRIGAISNEIEDVLKIAAFVVVPFCLFLIFTLSKNPDK